MRYPLRKFDTVHLVFTELAVQRFLYPSIRPTHAEIASQWNSVQRQDFIQRSAIDECQRIQAVNAGNLIVSLDVVQTAGSNLKSGLPVFFRKLPRERRATTIRVADGSPAVLRQNFAAPDWP
jgi:hypothetical protein